jgi:uncharacterized protein YoaH (UPF0181 family)
MANKIAISITAKDAASGPIGKVRSSIEGLGKQIRSSKIDKLGDSISMGLSSSGGAISAVTRFVGGSGLITGAVAALVGKMAQIESEWASSVRSMGNLGVRTGLSTRQAYGVQYAGRLAGLSPEQVNGGVEQVRQAYSDAVNNRNPEALKRFQAAGISTNPGRMEDIESVLTKLAAYASVLRSQGKYGGAQNFLGAAGAGQLVDFLDRGPAQVSADLVAAKSYIPTDDDIRRAKEYADESARLSITYDKLKTTILSDLEPALNGLLNGIQFGLDAASGRQRPTAAPGDEKNPQQRLWDGFERFGNALRGRGASTMAELSQKTAVGNGAQLQQARSDVEWYMNHGLSREHAIGMVANSSRESGLDERAVGDNGRAVGLYQWHPDRQAIYQRMFGRPLASASHEEQLGYSLWELQNNERGAGNALMGTATAPEAAAKISSLYERPKDPNESTVRAGIARELDSQLGESTGSPGKMRIEIVHKNAPAGTSVNVEASPNVDTSLTTDRQQAPLGEQYAYSPGNF